MNKLTILIFIVILFSCKKIEIEKVIVPFMLDHNRMLVSAEVQSKDSTWRKVSLWVDTGNPDFFISKELALDLGIITFEDSLRAVNGTVEISSPLGVRIGEMQLNFDEVNSFVVFSPFWLFKATQADANLPSTVLKKYDVVFDYPKKELILSKPGKMKFAGIPVQADINRTTGLVQVDGVIDKDSVSFALDNGASYSFGSIEFLTNLINKYPEQAICNGAVGYANIWGWGLSEEKWTVIRVPEMTFGDLIFENLGITIPPDFNNNGYGIMDWYSQKTVRLVDGFLGSNAFKNYSFGIDYSNNMVYFDKIGRYDSYDMDIIGLTLQPQEDGTYKIIGVAFKEGKPIVDGISPGDLLLQIDDLRVKNKTMGTVIDALRGKPGEIRNLILERNGNTIKICAEIKRII